MRIQSTRIILIPLIFVLLAFGVACSSSTNYQTNSSNADTPRVQRPAIASGADNSVNSSEQNAPDAAAPTPISLGNGVTVARSVKNDVSPRLRDIKVVPPQPYTQIREKPEPGEGQTLPPRPPVNDPVVQSTFAPRAPLLAPAPIQNFAGVSNLDGVYPPDTNGDAGPNHFVQWVNGHFQVWDKSGHSLYGPAAGNTLWSGFGGTCQTSNDGDPVVLYDSMADRWLLAQFTATNPYGECVAVSTTGDPTGTYYRYFFQFSTTVFYDYPKLGVWPDGYYMSANLFNGNTYNGPAAIVFNRSQMLNGQPATFQQFKAGTSYGTQLPSDLDGATLPPAGSPNFFAELGSTSLHLWKFHVDWNTPANSTFSGPTNLPIAAYNELCPTSNCVPQPSTTVKLDGLGDRLMHRLAYRNFGDHESLVVSHSVNAASSGTKAGVRWYEIRSPNGTPAIYQQGTFSPDTTQRWLPSVAMNKAGDIAIGYSVSSSSVYPSIRFTGRLAGDALGQMTQGETTLIAGSGSQKGTAGRWGDYSMMTIDPVDDCTFWFTTEYMPSTSTAPWQTRIGSFKLSSCGGTNPTPTPANTPTPSGPTATPTNTLTPAPPTDTPTVTNTPLPTNTPTVTNTPLPTNTPTVTNTPLPTNTPTNTPAPSSNLIVNPGFESGPGAGWSESSSGGYEIIDKVRPHAGAYSADECNYNSCTEYIEQAIKIPAGANLTYWWSMSSTEGTATAYDYLRVQLYSTSGTLLTTLRTWSNKNTRNTWAQDTISLAAYAGQTVKIRFISTTDSSLSSAFYIDDVSVK